MSLWARLLGQPVLLGIGAAALTLFGLAALFSLPIRDTPIIPSQMININTSFPGADAATLDRFVTLPLEGAVTSLQGVDYVTGSSQVGNSQISAYLADGADPNTVFAETLAAVNAARQNLPTAIQAPSLSLVGDQNANQEFNLTVTYPASVTLGQATAYTITNLIPRFETIPGIGPITVYTGPPNLLVTLNPLLMMTQGVTPEQVSQMLGDTSTVNAAGALRNTANMIPINAAGSLSSIAAIEALPVVTRGGVTVTLGSLANAAMNFNPGFDTVLYDGAPAVYAAAGIAPSGNVLDVARGIHAMVAALQPMMPPGLKLILSFDESVSVGKSLRDLALTLLTTILLVGAIVRLSLGTMRAALAPFVAIMLSLLGATLVMQITGQTFNLFTIMALVLAVGLVVDDAIVVVEDVFRRVAEGEAPLPAAQASVTRLAPVLAAISSTLVVAFLPLGFLSGLTAALFRPFALVLISAFLFSLALALTVVPYMALWASRHYQHIEQSSLIDHFRALYLRLLAPALRYTPLIAGVVLAAAIGCFLLARIAPSNLNPAPDGDDLFIYASAPNGASIAYVTRAAHEMEGIMHHLFPSQADWIDASEQNHAVFGGYEFASPEATAAAVVKLQAAFNALPDVSAYVNQDSGLPGSENLPVSINISGQTEAARLLAIANKMQADAYASGKFNYVQINPGLPQYQYVLRINRKLAATLGIPALGIGNTVAAALAGGNIGQVSIHGTALNITTSLPAEGGPEALESLQIATGSGALVPLGTVVTLQGGEAPNALGSWQGLPSVNLQGQQVTGVALSAALAVLRKSFAAQNTRDLSFDYSGPSETYQKANQQNAKLFELGLLGLFFLLAAQFRSLRDPFVVITTVPLASLGPLILFVAGGATLNIVTEIALLTVWGLIARQGILFVQVAHEGRGQMPIREAALRAARLRFRPILMITLALLGGAVPLVLARGPLASIRYDLGAVLATGMSSGFLLSLFAVPAMYCLLHRGRHEV